MATKNPFRIKINSIKYHYGQRAADHFEANPFCLTCREKRIACLSVHHVHGKAVDVFETLCANCHLLHHAKRTRNYTYEDYCKEHEDITDYQDSIMCRNAMICGRFLKGDSQADISREFNISSGSVSHIIKNFKLNTPNWQALTSLPQY
jgi:hypothetical protein